MATTSTVPDFHARFVTVAENALLTAGRDGGAVNVYYCWPGAVLQGKEEAVFGGTWPQQDNAATLLDIDFEIPTLKAGRKQREETYEFPFTVWTFRPDTDPTTPEVCHVRAFEIMDDLEDEFADDPQIGLSSIQWAVLSEIRQMLFPYESGWACTLEATVNVQARLT